MTLEINNIIVAGLKLIRMSLLRMIYLLIGCWHANLGSDDLFIDQFPWKQKIEVAKRCDWFRLSSATATTIQKIVFKLNFIYARRSCWAAWCSLAAASETRPDHVLVTHQSACVGPIANTYGSYRGNGQCFFRKKRKLAWSLLPLQKQCIDGSARWMKFLLFNALLCCTSWTKCGFILQPTPGR